MIHFLTLNDDLQGYASSSHNHDDRYSLLVHTHDNYYTISEIKELLKGYSKIDHTHSYVDITDTPEEVTTQLTVFQIDWVEESNSWFTSTTKIHDTEYIKNMDLETHDFGYDGICYTASNYNPRYNNLIFDLDLGSYSKAIINYRLTQANQYTDQRYCDWRIYKDDVEVYSNIHGNSDGPLLDNLLSLEVTSNCNLKFNVWATSNSTSSVCHGIFIIESIILYKS